jgi:ketosteroid isomerase-like protein
MGELGEKAAVEELNRVVDESYGALDAFVKGDSGPLKPFFARRDDVTLANPFGPTQRGWRAVEDAMDRAAANYTEGRALGFEEVSRLVTAELAYIVEVERYEAKVGGGADITPVSLRCTTIFCREEDSWKIVHRHADPITAARPAESVVHG